VLGVLQARPASAQAPQAPPAAPVTQSVPVVQAPSGDPLPVAQTACGRDVAAPVALPPAGSPPFVWIFQLCFNSQGGFSTIEGETYLYYIRLKDLVSRPKEGVFVP
jgi:hypothetical protein